jgi:hypothetical protein
VSYQSNKTTTFARQFVLTRHGRVISRNEQVDADGPVEPGYDECRVR